MSAWEPNLSPLLDADVVIQLLVDDADEVPFCNGHPSPKLYFKLATPNASWFDVVLMVELLDVCNPMCAKR